MKRIAISALGVAMLSSISFAQAQTLRVSVTNLAPANGTFLTPMWFGLHSGAFDIYDSGVAASPALESLAEDGSTAAISNLFTATAAGTIQGTLNGIGPIGPGASTSMDISVDGSVAANRFFSYASMIIPSNDAFIANGNPTAFQVFDASGNFTAVDFIVLGSMVLDAGTEVNDELPANTAFFGQAAPNTGVTQNGVVGIQAGFLPAAPGNILGSSMFANADFKQANYQVARVRVEAVPEPASMAALGLGVFGLLKRKRNKSTN